MSVSLRKGHIGYLSSPENLTPLVSFRINNGYYPLPLILQTYSSYKSFHTGYENTVLKYDLNIRNLASTIKYHRKTGRGNLIGILYSGLFSAFAQRKEPIIAPSKLNGSSSKRQDRVINDVDIFCLGVTKISKLPKLNFINRTGSLNFEIDEKDLKILVSKEKLRKSIFIKKNYTATVRRMILNQIEELQATGVVVEDVSDEYIESFLDKPKYVKTNSITKIMRIDQEIKDSVCSEILSNF